MPRPQNWVITGVSSGFGRSLAIVALNSGANVVGTVRQADQVDAFEALAPGRAKAVLLDVTDASSVSAGIGDAAHWLGPIDVMVNNAGYGLAGAVEETSESEAREIFETHLFGQLNVLRAVLPIMRRAGAGHLLPVSAIGGFSGVAGLGVYSAAKASIDILNESLALELAPFGIKVTILVLGIFRTDFASSSLKTTEGVLSSYAGTPSANFRAFISQLSGKQPNDPLRGAEAVMQVVASDHPPLHLALGADAVGVMEKKMARLRRDIDDWRNVSTSVAF